MRLYAKQAKNKELEADACEIRLRAERRVGRMMAEQPKAKPPGLNQYVDSGEGLFWGLGYWTRKRRALPACDPRRATAPSDGCASGHHVSGGGAQRQAG